MPANVQLELLGLVASRDRVNAHLIIGPGASVLCPANEWNSTVFDPDDFSQLGSASGTIPTVSGALTEFTVTVPVVLVPAFAPGGVSVSTGCDSSWNGEPVYGQVALNPVEASSRWIEWPQDHLLGGRVLFRGHTVQQFTKDRLVLDLFWEARRPSLEDYQVFVHVIDRRSGRVVSQDDGIPVNARYPTSQWMPNFLIRDHHVLHFAPSLRDGEYNIRIGLYRLADLQRLEVRPAGADVIDNAIELGTYSIDHR
jgi:hypothetical protein